MNLGKYFEPTVRVWANAPLTGADFNNPVAVVEPQLRFHFGDVNPYVGVILPFAGPITNPYAYGVRVGVTHRASFGEPAKPPSDRDGDCIVDTEDACPDVAGVKTDDPKTNGCPLDTDKDGIADSVDACPNVAGVKTGRSEDERLPAPTRDKDGIIGHGGCLAPNEAGVKTDDPKTNVAALSHAPRRTVTRTESRDAEDDATCPDVGRREGRTTRRRTAARPTTTST